MATKIAAYANCDDVIIFWKIDALIPNCLGFALERETIGDNGERTRVFLNNRTGFAGQGKKDEQRSSTEWPFQRFSWTDHKMDLGGRACYRVTPVIRDSVGTLQLAIDLRSDWTKELLLTGEVGDGMECYFNRGLVISQFMSRYLHNLQNQTGKTWPQTLKLFKDTLEQHETPIRQFLSGDLRQALVNLLEKTKKDKGHIYTALYELEDGELIDELLKLKKHAHVILANGSVDKVGKDQNKEARDRLTNKVDLYDRMTSPKGLGHNKFLVVCDKDKHPIAVWTGSTNWTKTGLCTQINNGFIIRNAATAQIYLDQWQRLLDAKSAFTDALVAANTQPKASQIGQSKLDIWFTKTKGKVDLDALNQIILNAQEAVLFLMFSPGKKELYKTIVDRWKNSPNLYMLGVVSDQPNLDDETKLDATIFGTSGKKGLGLKIVQPEGIATPFASWAETVTRNDFKANIGNAIVHSKLVVVDPFTNPIVITGSHNFSTNASAKNDENFVIVRGNTNLALAYASHIQSVYHHYRWLSFLSYKLSKGQDPWQYLVNSDGWQTYRLKGDYLKEMNFWVR
jgi:phosphatidylserine/phosphatidylglycerophosphate/cardiolipin synthase-like enzyme